MIHHRLRAAIYRARMWLRQMQVMIAKELRQLGRDRVLLLFIAYIFPGNIIIAAGETSTELNDAAVVVHDGDRSAASRELIYRFRPPYFRFSGEMAQPDQGLRLLERGSARLLLDIPEQFERTLQRGEQPATVQLLVDTSKANLGYLASSYSGRIAAGFGREWAERNLGAQGAGVGALPEMELRARIRYNPDLNETWFGTIAELLTMLTVACILLPASALVREKERGTIEQLLVSPLTPLQVMLSKVLSMVLVTLVGTAVSLFGIMRPLYSVPVEGSLGLFFALTALYAFTNAGLGLAAATFARSSGQTGMLVLLIVMPILMLSGIRTPMESMPEWLRAVLNLSPLHHYIEITYGILLRGAGLETLWPSILALAVLGSMLFGLGLWRFRRQFR
jgi:ABC-2 type transport system permease protein